MPKVKKSIYSVGSYTRLSKDDFHNSSKGSHASPHFNESNSISSQKQLIKSYADSQADMRLVKAYEDDGYTGLNFERPGFQALLQDIEIGMINCVIVKDFSRLGRDHIETGKYLKKIFPRLNVRFISINDDYDSQGEIRQSDHITMPFKNLMNDNYSRDISIKVRSHLEVKQKNGEFTGSFAVYGYQKVRQDRGNKLIPDEYAAGIVQEIFTMISKGYSLQGVAEVLNTHGILSPLEYKKYIGSRFYTDFETSAKAKWSAVAVKRIVKNKVYTGTLEQGKTEKINYKVNDRVSRPQEQWRRLENAHKPIITRELFEIVQAVLQKDTRRSPQQKSLYPFSGLLQCDDCGYTMVRKTEKHQEKKYVYYVCSTNKADKEQCSSHRLSEEKLKRNVSAVLRNYGILLKELDAILAEVERRSIQGKRVERLQNNLDILAQEKEDKIRLKLSLYEDYKLGILDEADYRDMTMSCTVRLKEIEQQKANLEVKIAELHRNPELAYSWIKEILKFEDEEILNRQYVVTVIKRIYILNNGDLRVELRHQDAYEEILEYINSEKALEFNGREAGEYIG